MWRPVQRLCELKKRRCSFLGSVGCEPCGREIKDAQVLGFILSGSRGAVGLPGLGQGDGLWGSAGHRCVGWDSLLITLLSLWTR